MLAHNDLRKGTRFVLDGQPFEVLEFFPVKMQQRRAVIQSKIKNLITGATIERNFHQGDVFEEAEIAKIEIKYLYKHRDKFVFCENKNPSKRFEFSAEQIGNNAKILKPNEVIDGLMFEGNIINISLPIKVQLKVTEAAPGMKGDRAQSGTKLVKVETGAEINAPLFVKEGDIIEINTVTNEYVRRVNE
jgi:elongation factor P